MKHLEADLRFSDDESLRNALESNRAKGYGQETCRVIAVDTNVLLRRL